MCGLGIYKLRMDLNACIESRVDGLQHMYNIIRKAMGHVVNTVDVCSY